MSALQVLGCGNAHSSMSRFRVDITIFGSLQQDGVPPEGHLYYQPAIGWTRLKPTAPVYAGILSTKQFQVWFVRGKGADDLMLNCLSMKSLPVSMLSQFLIPGEYERLNLAKVEKQQQS